LSKNQLKRKLKEEKWIQQKEAIKQKKKEKKKKSKTYIKTHADPELKEGQEGWKPTKQERVKAFKELCAEGPKYIIDCDFEDLMSSKELTSLG